MNPRSLPRPQEISLANTLEMALEFVRDARRWIADDRGRGLLPSLAEGQTERVEQLLGEIERNASELIARHRLRVEPPGLRGTLRSYASVLWANLIDSESGRMHRYGSVPEWYADEIDPKLKTMERAAHEIVALAREPDRP